MVLSETGMRKLVVPKGGTEMERTLPLSVHRTYMRNPNSSGGQDAAAEKVKRGISLIFSYVVAQVNEA